jgi:hypothetical protein
MVISMKQVFPIIPAGASVSGTLAGLGVFLFALLALFAYMQGDRGPRQQHGR